MSRGRLGSILLVSALAAALLLVASQPRECGGRKVDVTEIAVKRYSAGADETSERLEAAEPSGRKRLSSARTQVGEIETAQGGFASFSGRVVYPDGRPVADASVRARGTQDLDSLSSNGTEDSAAVVVLHAQTDELGSFQLPQPRQSGLRFRILIHSPASAPMEFLNLRSINDRTKDLGEIVVEPGASARGVVLDESGRPVGGALVRPLAAPDSERFRNLTLSPMPSFEGMSTRSDREGTFLLSGMPAGPIRIHAEYKGKGAGTSRAILLMPGEEPTAVQIDLLQRRAVIGTVLTLDGDPVDGAKLRLELRSGKFVYAMSGPEGEFRVHLSAGVRPIELACSASGHARTRLSLSDTWQSEDLRIELGHAPTVSGIIFGEDGRVVPGAEIRLVEARRIDHSVVNLARLEPLCMAVSDSNGRFRIVVDLSGTWEQRIALVVTAAGYGARAAGDVSFDDSPGRAMEEHRITLDRAFRVFGTVVSPVGEPVAGARVYLERVSKRRQQGVRPLLFADTISGEDGRYAIADVLSGTSRLRAVHHEFSPGLSEEFVVNQANIDVTLTLVPLTSLRGRVEYGTQRPGMLSVIAASTGGQELQVPVDSSGEFVLYGIVPGTYDLMVREFEPRTSEVVRHFGLGRGLPRMEDVVIAAGEEKFVVLRAECASRATVEGTVVVNGRPRAGLKLYLLPRNAERPHWAMLARQMRVGMTDIDGRYSISSILPGDYWLVAERGNAWPIGLFDLESQPDRRPSGLERGELSLEVGVRLKRDFDLHVGVVRGQAWMESEGSPPPRASNGWGTLAPATERPGIAHRRFRVWPDGTFHLFDVPVGSWVLRIEGTDGRVEDVGLEVLTKQPCDVEVLLRRDP